MSTGTTASRPGWQLLDFSPIGDARGWLVSLQGEGGIPFAIRRVYYIYGTQPDIRRGMHAHRHLDQVCVCVAGNCNFLLDDGIRRQVVRLDSPARGLYLSGVIWREMSDFSADCVLMVLASEHYDESDYIRDYDEFIAYTRSLRGKEA